MAFKPRFIEWRKRIHVLEAIGVRLPADIARCLEVPLRTVQADIAAHESRVSDPGKGRAAPPDHAAPAGGGGRWRTANSYPNGTPNEQGEERAKEATGGTGKRAGKCIEIQVEGQGRVGDVSDLREMRENDKYVAGLLGLRVEKHEDTG